MQSHASPSHASTDAASHLGDLTDGPALVDLSSLALIEVNGEDSQAFLQSQFSNDVAAANESSCQLNAYCNPKGRALALIRLLRRGDGFAMIVPAEMVDKLLARLKMFVLRAKVSIEQPPGIALLGLINDAHTATGAGLARAAVRGIIPRHILIGEKAALDAFARASGHALKPGDCWRRIDILSGIPQIYPQTAEEFIPQMINLDLVDGLSFSKGCYPGQEIIARLRYLGKPKKRMLAGIAHGIEHLEPGDFVYLAPSSHAPASQQTSQPPGQKAGVVVDAVKTPEGDCLIQTTAPTSMAEANMTEASEFEQGYLLVCADSTSTSVLTRIPLPSCGIDGKNR